MALRSTRLNEPTPSNQLGKYRLLATLGQGGMGTVYLACASGLGEFKKLIVVKELRQDLPWKETSLSMFTDEARLAARLDHPNVVQTFEAGHDGGRYFLAMEYLDGQPLSALIERMRKHGGVSLPLHIQILCDALAGLHYAHELRDYNGQALHVVHRDMSPQNVFVTYHGQVKVVDFGVAKAGNANTMTTPGMFKGKFAYAAPEQALGRPVDARSDVFAVGVMLWEAISGRRFSDQHPTAASFRARAGGLEPRIHQAVPDIDPTLADICDRALSVDPHERFESAEEFKNELQEYLIVHYGRVDNTQIGELMRQLFDGDRQIMHRTIEQAMGDGGSSQLYSGTLPVAPTEHTDHEPTVVGDLSSLALVSHESDEEKIRVGYHHSKVTPLRPSVLEMMPPLDAPAVTQAEPKRSRAPIAIGAAVVVAGALALLALGRSAPEANPPRAVPLQPTAAAAPAQPAAPEAPAAPAPSPRAAAPELQPAAAAQAQPAGDPEPSVEVAPGSPLPNRRAARYVPPRQVYAPARPAAISGTAVQAVQAPPAPAEVRDDSMGGDMRAVKRAPKTTIDLENPYQ